MNLPQQTPPIRDFFLLPEAMKGWLTSEQVVDHIIAINSRYSIRGEKLSILARLITQLSLSFFAPEALAIEIQKNLNIPPQEAMKVAAELKLKIFAPIADGFKSVQGIDVNKIPGPPIPTKQNAAPMPGNIPPASSGKTSSTESLRPQEPMRQDIRPSQAPPMEGPKKQQPPQDSFASKKEYFKSLSDLRPASLNVQPAENQVKTPVPPAPQKGKIDPENQNLVKANELKASTPKPFMLHEEKPQASADVSKQDFRFELPDAPKTPPVENKAPQAQTGNYFQGITQQESQKAPVTSETKQEKPKVVHYSAYRTLLEDKE
ncbi:MAG: hypothetical protein Q8P45_02140 [Candidatus Harrisonbacteria bacterium]|nr:hypothetical protein [Candidatus Harrisonbacteria bacterium]